MIFLISVVAVIVIVACLWHKGKKAGQTIDRGIQSVNEMNERKKAKQGQK